MVKSVLNNTSTLLFAGASFVGSAEDSGANVEIMVSIKADRNCLVRVEQSATGSNWDVIREFAYTASDSKNYMVGKVHQYFRTSVVNNSGFAMGVLRMATYLQEEFSSAVVKGTDAAGIERVIKTDAEGKLLMTFTGEVGPEGKSSYQVALDQGFVGDEDAWLLSLKGDQGLSVKGDKGDKGDPGDSAYQVAVDGGFVGDESAWLASLNGTDGTDGGIGNPGLSAYQVWIQEGNSGTQADYLNSLKGTSIKVLGTLTSAEILALDPNALSVNDAYFSSTDFKLYVFDGVDWVLSVSLRGEKGDKGDIGDTGGQGLPGNNGNDGDDGSNVLVLGNLANAGLLPANADVGHAYFIDDTFQLAVSRGPTLWSYSGSLQGPQGIQGLPGTPGGQGLPGPGVVAKGSVADLTALNAIPTPSAGDLYIVEADYKMYIYDGAAFQSSGVSMRGEKGDVGDTGPQGSVGSVGAQGNSIVVMGNVATAGLLPTGYDADDTGKAWFVNDTYVMSVWDGAAFQSSASLRGQQGIQGIQGIQGLAGISIDFLGPVADVAALAIISAGWGAADLNKTFYVTAEKALYVWNGTTFVATGSLQGIQGIQGVQGVQGFSFSFEGSDTSANIALLQTAFGAADQGRTYLETDTYQLNFWNGTNAVKTPSIRGSIGPTGANINVKGNVADLTALAAKVATAVLGDAWFVLSDDTLNVFDGVAFQSSGTLTGPQGPAGTLQAPTIVTYQVASGTNGGAIAAGAWTQRPLNSLTGGAGNGGISLNANKIQFQSHGTYKIDFVGVVYDAGAHMTRIHNVTTGGILATGTGDVCSNNNSGHSHGIATIIVAQNDEIDLQHYIGAAAANNLGLAVGSGENETFARVVIEKLA